MRTGMNLLLWTTHVTEEHFPLFAKLKQAGFDGVELPLFERRRRPLPEASARSWTTTAWAAPPSPSCNAGGQPDQPRRRPSARRASTTSSGPSR